MYKLKCTEENCNAEFHSHEMDKQKALADLSRQVQEHNAQSHDGSHHEKPEEALRQEVEQNMYEKKSRVKGVVIMDNHSGDHTHTTHSKQCNEENCKYVAKAHAHDDETAAEQLAQDLAAHNKEVHDKETSTEDIKQDVHDQMDRHGH